MALASSLVLLGIQKLFPGLGITTTLQAAIGRIDFYSAIMNGILAFLLFAGALHVDLVTAERPEMGDRPDGQHRRRHLDRGLPARDCGSPPACSASTCPSPGRWCSAR